MASPFSFIPRSLAKSKGRTTQTVPKLSTSTTVLRPNVNHPSTSGSNTAKAKYSNEDFTNLINLALSDYALWADPDIRRLVDCSNRPDSSEEADDGFVPLSHLLRRSVTLKPLNLTNFEIPIAKAVRLDVSSVVEVRLLVSDPSSSGWSSKRDNARDIGAYEIRLKNNDSTSPRPSQNYTKQDWEERTVYVENIPASYRSMSTTLNFVNALLDERGASEPTSSRVQGIVFPPHHQDKPGDAPTCKGFALVVLGDRLDVDFLLNKWPWNRQLGAQQESELSTEVNEATKFGFRAIPKSRWTKLRDEYLAHRERLIAEINAHQDAEPMIPIPIPATEYAIKPTVKIAEAPHEGPIREKSPKLDLSSPYPFNSLVFVRNIHPETNKTTLRKLFSTAFASSLARSEINGDGIDYVDFAKGMDSCHLRLATPQHARILVEHFIAHSTIHTRGLDEVGSPTDGKSQPVSMEIVTGKREELYWEKVPEKIRRQAVQKALSSATANLGTGNEDGRHDDTMKRKRQRR